MKRAIKKIISVILAVVMLMAFAVNTSAARPTAEFLSELHMAQASNADEAKKMLTDAGYKVIDKNLNPGGGDVVYLGYKTSKNVEDAITDISVMNMYGGFSMTSYDTILEESLNEYKDMIKYFRTAANEFAENYKAGTKEAKLAYRQLNYYYVETKTQKTYMGDYMLNFPEKDDDFANILMKGNWNILANIRTLLAMGVGSADKTISDKVAELTNNESIYGYAQHHNDAKTLYETYIGIQKDIKEIEENIEDIKADATLTDEEKAEYISLQQVIAAKYVAFAVVFESLPYKDSTYGKFLEENPTVTDYSVFYPVIEAMTPGQRALVPFGQSISLLIYDTITKTNEDLEAELQKVEAEFDPISVYLGTDLSIFDGSFAVTNDALRAEGATGKNWVNSSANANPKDLYYSIGFGVAGAAVLAVSAVFLKDSVSALSAYNHLVDTVDDLTQQIIDTKNAIDNGFGKTMEFVGLDYSKLHQVNLDNLKSLCSEYGEASSSLKSMSSASSLKAAVAGSVFGVVLGLVMMGLSIYNIVKIVNSYKVEYLDIPANMIDSKATEFGDRFIRYSVVNSFYKDGGATKTRAGDTNAYNGQQWVSIYYTKNYEAGKCMLANYDTPGGEADFGRYTPVHAFGKNNTCFDLNKYCGKSGAEKIFLAFSNSNAKKAAETDVPSVVGSIFNYGAMAISGVVGIGIGMGTMALVNLKKKKSEKIEID